MYLLIIGTSYNGASYTNKIKVGQISSIEIISNEAYFAILGFRFIIKQ